MLKLKSSENRVAKRSFQKSARLSRKNHESLFSISVLVPWIYLKFNSESFDIMHAINFFKFPCYPKSSGLEHGLVFCMNYK